MEDESHQDHFTLIYHNFRGMAQTIRYLLFYLDLPFNEILIKIGEDPASLDVVKNSKLKGDLELPCLVYRENLITDCFAIIRHLCTKAKK